MRDVVLGMADGLTVPFALAAGLSSAVAASRLVVTAGLAEIAAGTISMALGGYLAGRGEVEHYASERAREEREIVEVPAEEEAEVAAVFRKLGMTDDEIAPVIAALRKRPKTWVDFMMRFELGLERPDPKRAWRSALTIGLSYAAGGAVPLVPYLFVAEARSAMLMSAAVTSLALFVFGWVKGSIVGTSPVRSALQTVIIGGVAAAVAFGVARLVA